MSQVEEIHSMATQKFSCLPVASLIGNKRAETLLLCVLLRAKDRDLDKASWSEEGRSESTLTSTFPLSKRERERHSDSFGWCVNEKSGSSPLLPRLFSHFSSSSLFSSSGHVFPFFSMVFSFFLVAQGALSLTPGQAGGRPHKRRETHIKKRTQGAAAAAVLLRRLPPRLF